METLIFVAIVAVPLLLPPHWTYTLAVALNACVAIIGGTIVLLNAVRSIAPDASLWLGLNHSLDRFVGAFPIVLFIGAASWLAFSRWRNGWATNSRLLPDDWRAYEVPALWLALEARGLEVSPA